MVILSAMKFFKLYPIACWTQCARMMPSAVMGEKSF